MLSSELEEMFSWLETLPVTTICCWEDVVEHINHAEESGKVAGVNMAGGHDTYSNQSSFWSTLGPTLSWDAVGKVDANLDTHAFFSGPPGLEGQDYSYPGVVFYLEKGRLVGILLWNLVDDLYQDKKRFAPSRMNFARSLLKDRRSFGDNPREALAQLARHFDLYGVVNEDYQELSKFLETQAEAEQENAEKS